MGISNIERMVEALVRDEMNYCRMLSLEDLDLYLESLLRENFERMDNAKIIEQYEMIGD